MQVMLQILRIAKLLNDGVYAFAAGRSNGTVGAGPAEVGNHFAQFPSVLIPEESEAADEMLAVQGVENQSLGPLGGSEKLRHFSRELFDIGPLFLAELCDFGRLFFRIHRIDESGNASGVVRVIKMEEYHLSVGRLGAVEAICKELDLLCNLGRYLKLVDVVVEQRAGRAPFDYRVCRVLERFVYAAKS